MGEYKVILNDEQEKFLDIYLAVCPLRPPDERKDYPHRVATNFIESMRKRENEFRERFEQMKKEGKIK